MTEKKNTYSLFSKAEALRFGWQVTRKKFWFLTSLIVVNAVVNWSFSLITNPVLANENGFIKFIGLLLYVVGLIVSLEISFAKLAVYFKVADKKEARKRDLFAYFNAALLIRYFVIMAVYMLITFIGLLLFVVPGIYFATKYWFAPYIFVDRRTGILESFRESARLTKGTKWQLFLLGILQVLIILAGALALLVGLFVALPTNTLSDIYVYRKLSAGNRATTH